MLFNHYVDEMEANEIVEACRDFDFGAAFDKFSDAGDYDRDRKYDLLAMAVAGVPNTRKALAYGIAIDDCGNAHFGIPSQREAHAHNDRDLKITDETGMTINVPVIRDEADAKHWLNTLTDVQKELAKMFLTELYGYAVDAYTEEGRYIEGASCPEYPEWLDEEKGA